MATDALKGIGTIEINNLDLCIKSWDVSEASTSIDTTSTCDGDGESSLQSNKKLTITGEAFYSDSRTHHHASSHNLNVGETVDVEAFIGTSSTRKYTITDGKVIEWRVRSQVKDAVTVSFTIESQGPKNGTPGYTVPTA